MNDLAKEWFDQAFDPNKGRTQRSQAYKHGVMDHLQWFCAGTPIPSRYQPGSAEFDAYHAGQTEAMAIIRANEP